jgi:hypothetical protein
MLNAKRSFIGATFGFVVSLSLAGVAQAATCGPGIGGTHTFSLTTSDATASCFAYGEGNLNGQATQDGLSTTWLAPGFLTPDPANADPMLENGFNLLTKVDVGNGSTSGTWSFNVSGLYNAYVFALKVGESAHPNWAAFLLTDILTAGLLSGNYAITPQQGADLSHYVVYGINDPNFNTPPVPIPGAVFLFGSVLAGSWWIKKRRERRMNRALIAA